MLPTEFPSLSDLKNIIKIVAATSWKFPVYEATIQRWLSNFNGSVYSLEVEHRLALWMLANFTYYNDSETTHLCKVLLKELIHSIAIKNAPSNSTVQTIFTDFLRDSTIIPPEPTSGSAGFIAYKFRQINNLPLEIFEFSIERAPLTKNNIILIDDVVLSIAEAGQVSSFLRKNQSALVDKSITILCLITTKECIEYMRSTYNASIISAIVLDERSKCFHPNSYTFSSFSNTSYKSELVQASKEIATHYGFKIDIGGVSPLGHSNCEYSFGFYYNTPDNTMPIFWGEKNGWIPFFTRHHKITKLVSYEIRDRFV